MNFLVTAQRIDGSEAHFEGTMNEVCVYIAGLDYTTPEFIGVQIAPQ
jgi:hypothetical protein